MTTTFNTVLATAKNTVSIFNDNDWDTVVEADAEKPKEYLQFNKPPLELVVAMLDAKKELFEIVEAVKGVGVHPAISVDGAVDKSHQERAQEIYDYFAKKYTMRRLKGEFISKYMTAVEELCEDRTKLDIESLPILVTLPKIYEQNRELESLMKAHKSISAQMAKYSIAIDETVEFVKKVVFDRKGSHETHYFWRRPCNSLIRTVSKTHDISNSAWECLSKHGKIRIVTQNASALTIKGYDFYVLGIYNPSNISIAS